MTHGPMMLTAPWKAGGVPWTLLSGPMSRSTIRAVSAPYVQAHSVTRITELLTSESSFFHCVFKAISL